MKDKYQFHLWKLTIQFYLTGTCERDWEFERNIDHPIYHFWTLWNPFGWLNILVRKA